MISTFLDKLVASKRSRIEEAKRSVDVVGLSRAAVEISTKKTPNRLQTALQRTDRINIIAEFKRASPSKGMISDRLDAVEVANMYTNGGACAISVLTEEDYFLGSLNDLRRIRENVDLPILRKDFLVDDYQILESAAAGADAILLIASILSPESLMRLQKLANDFGLDAVIEVHDREEIEIAIEVDAKIIGVNNRNLETFEVSLDTSRALIEHAPKGSILISESGISSPEQIAELRRVGYSGFLIGESLMRSNDPQRMLEELASFDEDVLEVSGSQ
ncbi:MAG: indole-3-glycerol phosphate synthase TrpC [Acidobacteria bacterium]|nr:MAG: indole-3-glycerol phosphate synthase TrpC [Acidobacteriota bacterium]